MRKELKEHAQSLQLGKSVIIQDSEDIIARKVDKIEQEYSEQVRKFQEELIGLRAIEQAARDQIDSKQALIKEEKRRNSEMSFEIEKLNKQALIKKETHKYSFEKAFPPKQNYYMF